MTETPRPQVGVGIYIRKDGKVLLGKRKNAHGAGTWSGPGGHLEMFESFEDCARREVLEETGLEIENIRLMTSTNDFFEAEGKHYITLAMVADWKSGEAVNLEPEYCEGWEWFGWDELPEPKAPYFRNFEKTGYNPLNF
ncbi:MAG: NUDIX domain-containing protein [Candidatus Pacebacteria bacterium]|nr:NUDIX domain-containing protein [Candidatus Paceibacterota bacterium]